MNVIDFGIDITVILSLIGLGAVAIRYYRKSKGVLKIAEVILVEVNKVLADDKVTKAELLELMETVKQELEKEIQTQS